MFAYNKNIKEIWYIGYLEFKKIPKNWNKINSIDLVKTIAENGFIKENENKKISNLFTLLPKYKFILKRQKQVNILVLY
jgi:hypothetical protein